MYQDRVLTSEEELYISRAQQKIAELTATLAEEYSRNDIDDYKAQLAIELQYSIEVLRSTTLDWSEQDIVGMTDYYTIRGKLTVFPFVGIDYKPISGGSGGSTIYATIPQLTAVDQASLERDAALRDDLDAEILARIAGDAALQAQIDLLGAGGALTIEITSQVALGAIVVGQVFPVGTLLQDIWVLALSTPTTVENFTFDSYADVKDAALGFTITQFTWNVVGTPVNLKLSDSEGNIINQSVTGSSYTPALPVDYNVPAKEIYFTLSADNMEDVVIWLDLVYKSYYGKKIVSDDTGFTVIESEVLAGTEYLVKTEEYIDVLTDTNNTEVGWVAVPQVQTGLDFTRWLESPSNESIIAVGDFITPPITLLVGGVNYSIYKWGYRSPLVSNLTLYR